MQRNAKKPRARRLFRYCVIADCAKKLNIVVRPDKTYNGGHYFGKMHTGKGKKVEYWECEACYQDSKAVEDL